MTRSRNAFGPVKLPRDPLFRLLLINGIAGVVVAALVLGGIFMTNIGNLRVLVMSSDEPVLPVIMLACGLVITLASVVMGSAVMLVGEKDAGGGTPRKAVNLRRQPALEPAPVRAMSQRSDIYR